MTEILRDGGYGLITQANGLDTVQKLALRDGVPAAVVFRDFDGAGQTPTVMRRFLDQAAFRAGQGAKIFLNHLLQLHSGIFLIILLLSVKTFLEHFYPFMLQKRTSMLRWTFMDLGDLLRDQIVQELVDMQESDLQ